MGPQQIRLGLLERGDGCNPSAIEFDSLPSLQIVKGDKNV